MNTNQYSRDDAGRKIVEDRVVKRRAGGCIIANYGHCIINGNIILCNNYNLTNLINFSCIYDQHISYGTVYNSGIFDMLRGYIGWNTGNGVFNAQNATFNMHDGGIFKNLAYHGGGVLNYGIFNMYGGKISTNRVYFHGAGVYNRGSLNMFNGTISANETDFSDVQSDIVNAGGGIYNDTIGILKLDDGIITMNYSKNGGGVFNRGYVINCNSDSIIQNTILDICYYPMRHYVRLGTEDDRILDYLIESTPYRISNKNANYCNMPNQ